MRALKALGLGSLLLALTACAATPPDAANDPYEAFNRQTLARNIKIDRYIVGPAVGAYLALVPEDGRQAVHNLLGNLSLPTIFVNDMLQGESARGVQSLERLAINTTLGLGGFFDVAASQFHIPGHGEDFGQTLAVWGADEGPFLMLPLLGPSNPRDAGGLVADAVIDPTNYIAFKQHIWWSGAREFFTVLDLKAQTYQTIQGIQRSSVDYYASLRSLYRQLRENEIRNGRPRPADLPDF